MQNDGTRRVRNEKERKMRQIDMWREEARRDKEAEEYKTN